MTTEAILARFAGLRILVIGDLMLDHYLWGDVHRISPEAPVPVIHVERETNTAGGAANVALNLAALGVRTEVLGTLGADEAGATLRTLLSRAAIAADRCWVAENSPTIVKTRVIARTQQMCRIDRESARSAYSLQPAPDLTARLEAAISEADAVIVSDYAKGVIDQPLLDTVLRLAREHQVLVAVDPKPARALAFREVDLLTPNRHEALLLAGVPEPGLGEPYPLEEIGRRIHASFSPRLLVITLGAAGMAVCKSGEIETTIPTEAREVFDVSGAGDTVIAVLTAALAAGADPVTTARLANRAAGIVVSKIGTATVSPQELLRAG